VSEDSLHLIPENPGYEPSPEALETTRLVISEWTDGEVATERSDAMAFIDSGASQEEVRCPSCGHEVEDWGEWMSECWDDDKGFDLDARPLSCCRLEATLHELDYGQFGAGFARATVSATPRSREPLSELIPANRPRIEAAFENPVRFIWRHT